MDNLEIINIDIILDPIKSGEAIAILAEFKVNINEWLKELRKSPVRSLADIIAFNSENTVLVSIKECFNSVFVAKQALNFTALYLIFFKNGRKGWRSMVKISLLHQR